jgi:hypothetical protein
LDLEFFGEAVGCQSFFSLHDRLVDETKNEQDLRLYQSEGGEGRLQDSESKSLVDIDF